MKNNHSQASEINPGNQIHGVADLQCPQWCAGALKMRKALRIA
jgi:hypothetical protein